MCVDLGMVPKKIAPPGGGVEVGILGGQKIKKVWEMSLTFQKINKTIFYPPHPGGSPEVGGQNVKSPGNFMNCRDYR